MKAILEIHKGKAYAKKLWFYKLISNVIVITKPPLLEYKFKGYGYIGVKEGMKIRIKDNKLIAFWD
jgi:hypothetical protein